MKTSKRSQKKRAKKSEQQEAEAITYLTIGARLGLWRIRILRDEVIFIRPEK